MPGAADVKFELFTSARGYLGQFRPVDDASAGFLVILGSPGLGPALAVGLGAKEIVGRRLESWVEKVEHETSASKGGKEESD
ncbi:MAG: hypothetical protein R6V85_18820 [Polyangia bacterium]